MGRYGDIAFMPETRVPATTGDLVVRVSWRGHFVAGLLLLAIGLGLPIFVLVTESGSVAFEPGLDFDTLFTLFTIGIAGLVVLVVTLVSLLGGIAFMSSAVAALRSTNWVLRAGPEGIYVKLRSYADHRLPRDDPVVAFIPKREVRWLQAHDERARHVGRAGGFTNTEDDTLVGQQYLEIKLFGEDLSEIEEQLKRERSSQRPTFVKGVTAKAKGAAVAVRPNGVLRIDWKTKRTHLRPALKAAMSRLARDYRAAPDVDSEQAEIKSLSRDFQEERLLEMVQQGNTMDAVILARGLYGFDLTEAKAFLEELRQA